MSEILQRPKYVYGNEKNLFDYIVHCIERCERNYLCEMNELCRICVYGLPGTTPFNDNAIDAFSRPSANMANFNDSSILFRVCKELAMQIVALYGRK